MTDIGSYRRDIGAMVDELLAANEVPYAETTELQRQVLAAFAFGMCHVVGTEHQLQSAQVHALSICMLIDCLGYSDEQAGAFSQDLIDSAAGFGNPTTEAIIHRGIDGHRQWQARDMSALRRNLGEIFESLGQ